MVQTGWECREMFSPVAPCSSWPAFSFLVLKDPLWKLRVPECCVQSWSWFCPGGHLQCTLVQRRAARRVLSRYAIGGDASPPGEYLRCKNLRNHGSSARMENAEREQKPKKTADRLALCRDSMNYRLTNHRPASIWALRYLAPSGSARTDI